MVHVSIGASSAENLQLERFFGLYTRAGRGRFWEGYEVRGLCSGFKELYVVNDNERSEVAFAHGSA
jgi:hypothetical protein